MTITGLPTHKTEPAYYALRGFRAPASPHDEASWHDGSFAVRSRRHRSLRTWASTRLGSARPRGRC
jgi:hypothetical protein